jgi:hypothetical protein
LEIFTIFSVSAAARLYLFLISGGGGCIFWKKSAAARLYLFLISGGGGYIFWKKSAAAAQPIG